MRALVCLALAGCAQVLGLDETRFESGGPDAAVDAAGPCDEVPASCTSTSGRSLCGQLYAPGGAPVRNADGNELQCLAGGEGVCQFTVTAIAYDQYTTAAPGPIAGTIDTCGRWQINDLDPTVARAAVLFDAPNHIQTAALVDVDTTKAEAITGLRSYGVSMAQLGTWGTQVGALEGPITSTGYLIEYRTAAGARSKDVRVTYNDEGPLSNPVGTAPWAAYFDGAEEFGTLATTFDDPTPTVPRTDASGTALAVIETEIDLKGVRGGARCTAADLHQVPGALIYLAILGC